MFNLEEAFLEQKRCYRTHDIRGLANINIQFCEELGGFDDRLPKICFFLSYLRDIDELNAFLRRNRDLIMIHTELETQNLANRCLTYGAKYENLPFHLRMEISQYFESPKYCVMFMEMMFEYKKFVGDINSLGIEKLNVRNSTFSKELVDSVSKALVYQIDHYLVYDLLGDTWDELADDIIVYSRLSNKVCRIESHGAFITNIHFPIEICLQQDEGVRLSLEILNIFSEELYLECLAHVADDIEYASMQTFSDGDLIELISFLSRSIVSDEKQVFRFVLEKMSLHFLNTINSLPLSRVDVFE